MAFRDVLLATGIVFLFATFGAAAPPPNASFLQNGVTAHRGNSGEFPENTIPAFQSGIDLGVDWLELDVLRSKDGQLVVIHDLTTGRVGDKNLVVAESTYNELRTVDVATDFRQRHGRTIDDCPPQTIPRLEDVLRLVMRQERTRLSIQPKTDCVADVIDLVKRLGAEQWVGFNDGHHPYLAEAKRLAPGIPVFWDRGGATNLEEDLRFAQQHGFEALVVHHSGITSEKVRKIKAAGIEVGAWTVNDRAAMERLHALGVERIYTDHPRLLLALRTEQRFHAVSCAGVYPHHLQGICADEDSIYWSFTTQLVKTDREGKVLKQAPVANHHGDLCFGAGKIYVAVNLGKFNDARGNADSWVYVYDARDLSLVSKHAVQEVFHGAGGIEVRDGRFFVVGGLPAGVEENYVYEYDGDFRFVKRHVIKSGHTHLGIQTAAFANDRWWFGCYGTPQTLLVTDAHFNNVRRHEFGASLGITPLGEQRFLVGRGACSQGVGCTGRAVLAEADSEHGLKVTPEAAPKN